jgi:hypothetical protein
MPNKYAHEELTDEELEWRKELDEAIFDFVSEFAPPHMVMDMSCRADWVGELREHLSHIWATFGDTDEEKAALEVLPTPLTVQ